MSPERIRPGSAKRLEQDRELGEVVGKEQLTAPAEEPLEPASASDQLGLSDVDATDHFESSSEEALAAPGDGAASAPEPAIPAEPVHHGAFRRLYYGETRFDFVRRRRFWFALSLTIILAGVISLSTRGLNLGIDFVGGTSWTIPAGKATPTSVQNALVAHGITGATVVELGTPTTHSETIEVELKLAKNHATSASTENVVSNILSKASGKPANDVSVESVGPSWGGQITHKAIVALIVFFILIAAYISVFFEWRMALAAIVAVAHDIMVTVGVYSLTGFEVTPDTVVAILTILGYSLYDTIVVFDRVRDNTRHLSIRDRLSFSDVVNLSMNQTLARSINTSLVAILPILSLLVLGADVLGATTLQYFGLALLVGLAAGAYSSIFIASPLVAILKEREPRYRQLRERLALRGADRVLLSAAAIASGTGIENLTPPPRAGAQSQPARPRPADGSLQGDELLAEPDEVVAPPGVRPAPPSRPGRPPTRRPAARAKRKGGRR